MKTPTVLRPKENVPPVKAGCRGFDGAWMPPSDHPNKFGLVGLGGHHLTAHRNRLHAGSPPSSAHPLRVQNPLYQEPAAELPARGVVHRRPAGLQESQCEGFV